MRALRQAVRSVCDKQEILAYLEANGWTTLADLRAAMRLSTAGNWLQKTVSEMVDRNELRARGGWSGGPYQVNLLPGRAPLHASVDLLVIEATLAWHALEAIPEQTPLARRLGAAITRTKGHIRQLEAVLPVEGGAR